MAVSKMADIQELLPKVHELLEKAIADVKYEKILALAEQVPMDGDPWDSRNMIKYYGVETLPEGAYGPITEAAPAFHDPQAGDAIEPFMSPLVMSGTLGWSLQQKMQAESADSKHSLLKIAKRMLGFARRIRKVNAKLFLGRGDGVVARANAASTNDTTFEAAANGPFFPVRGMRLKGYSLPAGETNDERLKTRSDTGTGYMGDTIEQVIGINPEATQPTITLKTTSAWRDDAVLVIADGATNSFPSGLQNHLDAPTRDSSMTWDSEDGSSTDHTDTYLGLARSSNPDLECQTYNVAAAISTSVLAKAVAICEAQGALASDLVLMLNPFQIRKLQDTFQGGTRFESKKVFLAKVGVDNFPVLTGEGYGDLKTIQDYGIPRDKGILVDRNRLKQFRTKIQWIDGGKLQLVSQSSTANHQAEWHSYLVMLWQSGLFLPVSSLVMYGLTT